MQWKYVAKKYVFKWRSQPDNLVSLCKFKIIIIISFLQKLIVFTVNEHINKTFA